LSITCSMIIYYYHMYLFMIAFGCTVLIKVEGYRFLVVAGVDYGE
jgi:hypothetical protein